MYQKNRKNQLGLYDESKQFKPYQIKKTQSTCQKLSKAEKKFNRVKKNITQKFLAEQEQGRKEHFNRQTSKVQERMKMSLEESEKNRRR